MTAPSLASHPNYLTLISKGQYQWMQKNKKQKKTVYYQK